MGGKREEEEGECVKMESGGRLEGVCEDGVWREGVVMKVTKKEGRMKRHLCVRTGIEVGSGGFGSEEVSEGWFWEVLC